MGHYESFFITSAGASAASLGLLVVAVSVVNADDANPTTRELRTVLAGSAFVALVDIFLVSIGVHSRGSSCPESVINLQFDPLRASVARIWPAGLRELAAGLLLR